MRQFTALIIDDNASNRKVLHQLLIQEGAEVHSVSDSSTLPAVLEGLGAVDVFFVDLEMPQYDGYEVRALIRQSSRFVGVPIIAYTVHVNEINTARKQGFDGFLAKPLDADRFPEQLGRILRGESVWVSK